MTDETTGRPDPATAGGGNPDDDTLLRAARLARDAAGNASAAAALARTAGTEFWKAVSAIGSAPRDVAGNVVKFVPGTDTASQLVDGGLRTVKWVAAPVLGDSEPEPAAPSPDAAVMLRVRGNALLGVSHRPESQSRDVHRSFGRILDELMPDEARIVRFLAVAGPQPSIDVRTKTLFQIGSRRLVSGVSMVAEMAGCRWWDRDRHYLGNLRRLGLVTFSAEPVDDFRRYSLLEVQEAALEVLEHTKSISVYRSICLSEFGQQFADVCFDVTGYTAGGWDSYDRGDKMIGKGPPEFRDR